MNRTLLLTIGLTLVIALIIAIGTLMPPGHGDTALPFTDKQLHFLAFFALSLPLGWLRPSWVLWLVPIALGYAAAIELVQPTVGRSAEWGDLVADALGIAAGVLPGQIRHLRKRAKA